MPRSTNSATTRDKPAEIRSVKAFWFHDNGAKQSAPRHTPAANSIPLNHPTTASPCRPGVSITATSTRPSAIAAVTIRTTNAVRRAGPGSLRKSILLKDGLIVLLERRIRDVLAQIAVGDCKDNQ